MTYSQPQDSSQPQETSTWAIVSLIGGIVSFIFAPFIGAVVGVIAGYIAKKEIRESNGRLSGEGLATGGLIISWVNIALSFVACVFTVLVLAGVFGSAVLFGPLTGLFK